MNSKGFKNFSQGGFNPKGMGSNPRALAPILIGGAFLYALSQSIYYGINTIIDS